MAFTINIRNVRYAQGFLLVSKPLAWENKIRDASWANDDGYVFTTL